MQVQCPSCSQVVEFPDDSAGRVVSCPACSAQMQVPEAPVLAEAGVQPPAAAAGAAAAPEPTKQCPFCGETILKIARKCKHCKEEVPEGTDDESVKARLCAKEARVAQLLSEPLPPVSYPLGGKFRVSTIVSACISAASLISAAVGFCFDERSPIFILGPLGVMVLIISALFTLAFFLRDLCIPSYWGRITPEKGLKAFLKGLCGKRYKYAYACLLDADKDGLSRLRRPVVKMGVVQGEFRFDSYDGFRKYWKDLLHYKGSSASVRRIRLMQSDEKRAVVSAEIRLDRHSTAGFLLLGILGAILMGEKETLKVSKLLYRVGDQWFVANGELNSAEDRVFRAAEEPARALR